MSYLVNLNDDIRTCLRGSGIVFPVFRNRAPFSAINLDDIEKFSNLGFLFSTKQYCIECSLRHPPCQNELAEAPTVSFGTLRINKYNQSYRATVCQNNDAETSRVGHEPEKHLLR